MIFSLLMYSYDILMHSYKTFFFYIFISFRVNSPSFSMQDFSDEILPADQTVNRVFNKSIPLLIMFAVLTLKLFTTLSSMFGILIPDVRITRFVNFLDIPTCDSRLMGLRDKRVS